MVFARRRSYPTNKFLPKNTNLMNTTNCQKFIVKNDNINFTLGFASDVVLPNEVDR